jgi:hypothetical protein
MTDAEFWETERQLWLGGPEVFRRWIARECLMVFPEPVGILTGPAVIESIAPAPRWERVEFAGGALRRSGTEATVLAYRAEAVRPGGAPQRALCSSTYVRQAGAWWMVQHQQTPV